MCEGDVIKTSYSSLQSGSSEQESKGYSEMAKQIYLVFPFTLVAIILIGTNASSSTGTSDTDNGLRRLTRSVSSCRNPSGNDCSWYSDCLDRHNPCYGSENYAINYGHHYCNKYSQNLWRFSAKAQRWIAATKSCLQNALKHHVGTGISCDNLKTAAFNSHTDCYVDNGFCDLSADDYREITKLVGNALIPFSGSSWLTSLNGGSTLYSCAQRYLSGLADDFGNQFDDAINDLRGWLRNQG